MTSIGKGVKETDKLPGKRTHLLPNGVGQAIVAHTGFGLYVIFVKYLLQYLPAFGTLAIAFTIALPLVLLVTFRVIKWREFGRWEMWLLGGLALARSITKLLAIQFTFAVYVQLIDMAVPLLTPLLAWLLLREEMPSGTLPAILATSLGSFLVVTRDPLHLSLPNGVDDLVGIGFAFASAVLMTFAVIYTRRLTTRKQSFAPEGLALAQVMLVAVTYWVLSLTAQESWPSFSQTAPHVWVVFILFVLVSIVAASVLQIRSISRIKAALFSTLLSWRLVVAVVMGWLLLGERLSTVWQVAGVLLVMGTITLYVQRQASTTENPLSRVLD